MRKEDYERFMQTRKGRLSVCSVAALEWKSDSNLCLCVNLTGQLWDAAGEVELNLAALQRLPWDVEPGTTTVREYIMDRLLTRIHETTGRRWSGELYDTNNGLIPLALFAKRHGKTHSTAYRRAAAGRFPGAVMTADGWRIPANAPWPADNRVTAGGAFSGWREKTSERHTSLSNAFYDRIKAEKHIKTARAEYKYENGKYYRLDVIEGTWEEI